jgi:hypothetical protein
MALRRSAAPPIKEVAVYQEAAAGAAPRDMRALVAAAAAMQLDEPRAPGRRKVGDEEWQREAWRHYDICGELRFAANRHAGALSQCRLYVAEVDDQGNPGEETKDKDVQALGEVVFGGPAKKAEYLRTIDVQLYVGGESYVIAEGSAKKDSDVWYIVSPSQVRKNVRGGYKVERPQEFGGGWHDVDAASDLMTRIWTPHPKKYDLADSSVRSVLPVLREIERLSMLTFSQIDSRLISAGLLLLPQGLTFPDKDGNNQGIKGLLEMILEVASAQLSGAGTAAGLLPILAEIPPGTGNEIEHVKFETALQAELKDKLDHNIRRLATGLDIDPAELLGQGDSNHWSAWQIDENGVKLFIRPPMVRICDGLTIGYLRAALKTIGKDPDRFMFWFDPSALTVRPNRFEDALQLYDRQEIDGEELRKSGNFGDGTVPDKKELAAQRAWTLVKQDPKLLSNKAIADLVGLPVVEEPQPAQPALPPGADQAPGEDQGQGNGQDQGDSLGQLMGLPQTESGGPSPAQKGLTASILPGAEQVVLRALELAGGRLLDRHTRGKFANVDRVELHTRVRPGDRDHARRLLDGAFTHVPVLARHHGLNPGQLTFVLGEYCVELLVRGYAHETDLLRAMLDAAGRQVTGVG